MSQHLSRSEFAWQLAQLGGKSTLEYFQSARFTVEKKSDRSPVTIADRNAEQIMRAEIKKSFPDDAIVGEEFGAEEGDSGYRWILDPIDGTKSFISGVPLYGTMVGVEYEKDCVIGAVYCPGLDEGVYALSGNGAWHQKGGEQPTKAQVSNCTELSEAVMVTSEVLTFDEVNATEIYKSLESKAYVARTWGDCYGYMLVATGRVELMIDPMLNIWDAAAVKPIIEEAGGRFVDWNGEPKIDTGNSFGCCPGIYEEVFEVISKSHS